MKHKKKTDEKQLINLLEKFDDNRQAIAELELENKQLKAEIVAHVGEDTATVGRFTIKTYEQSRFQQKEFQEAYPGLYASFCEYGKPVTYITANKED